MSSAGDTRGWTGHFVLLRGLLRKPYAIVGILVVGLLLLSPSLLTGRLLDDEVHRLMLDGGGPFPELARKPWDLYAFLLDDPAWRQTLFERGSLPWFTDPSLHVSFFRPLSSLTLYLDHRLWPGSLLAAHLHSMGWYVALVLVVWRLFTRLMPVAWVATLATLMYALDDARGMTVGWIANRNALIASVFGAAAVLAHVRWRESKRHLYGAASAGLLAVGLLAGETALGFGAYLLAFALVLDEGSWRSRLASLVPATAVVVAWRVAYAAMGYGAGGSDMYVDPVASPGRFVLALAERLPVMLATQLSPLPSYLYSGASRSGAVTVAIVYGAVVVGLGGYGWRRLSQSRLAHFAAIGMVVAAVPTTATFPHERLLGATGIGAFALVALVLASALERHDEGDVDASRDGRPRGQRLAGLLALTHLGLGPLLLPLSAYSHELFARGFRAAAQSLDRAEDFKGKTLVMVHGPDFFFSAWTPLLRGAEGKTHPRQLRVLATSNGGVEVRRTSNRALSIRADEGIGSSPFDTLLRRRSRPLEVDETVELPGVRFRVESVASTGLPTGVECLFDRDLDDPDYVWVAWHPDGYRPFQPPRQGESVELPGFHPRDVLGLVRGR